MLRQRFVPVAFAALLLSTAYSPLALRAEDTPSAKGKKPAAAKTKEAAEDGMEMEADDGKGRLPVYFAKLGLTPPEKEKIQAAMAKHQEEIKLHEKAIKKAHEDMEQSAEKLLTPEQKKLLEKLRAEAKAARDKKSAAKKGTEKMDKKEVPEDPKAEKPKN